MASRAVANDDVDLFGPGAWGVWAVAFCEVIDVTEFGCAFCAVVESGTRVVIGETVLADATVARGGPDVVTKAFVVGEGVVVGESVVGGAVDDGMVVEGNVDADVVADGVVGVGALMVAVSATTSYPKSLKTVSDPYAEFASGQFPGKVRVAASKSERHEFPVLSHACSDPTKPIGAPPTSETFAAIDSLIVGDVKDTEARGARAPDAGVPKIETVPAPLDARGAPTTATPSSRPTLLPKPSSFVGLVGCRLRPRFQDPSRRM